ncbi:hypothetical protein Poly59_30440 [Rubripirellula reticaptiva]|uniref:Uncharacterized protein n=1 Tax=Rubripirellula reticaptiva TaxID=2528013 RepID=A0A5C6EQX7_9BACT|nr:hypothetical protein Poly59_30440 [Rubripirellula reticaptiva]
MTIRFLLAVTLAVALCIVAWKINWGVSIFLSAATFVVVASVGLKRIAPTRTTRILVCTLLIVVAYALSFGPAIAVDQFLHCHRPGTTKYYAVPTVCQRLYPLHSILSDPSETGDAARRYRRLISSYQMHWRSVGTDCRMFADAFLQNI